MAVTILALDLGNTRAKAGWFDGSGRLTSQLALDYDASGPATLQALLRAQPVQAIGICNVGQPNPALLAALPADVDRYEVTPFGPGLVTNAYGTPETLGADRWAAVNGARHRQPHGPLLVLDFGTALTYDYVDRQNQYQGGAISLGLTLRYRALHQHTAQLPLQTVQAWDDIPAVGNTTATSLQLGVQQAMALEVAAMVAHFGTLDAGLTVFVTGGDALLFEKRLGLPIFASPDLVLEGVDRLTRLRLR